jgi:hypothetical protein
LRIISEEDYGFDDDGDGGGWTWEKSFFLLGDLLKVDWLISRVVENINIVGFGGESGRASRLLGKFEWAIK